jgi:hypothetical protein
MRAPILSAAVLAAIVIAASTLTLAPTPAKACTGFDFDAEIASVNKALEKFDRSSPKFVKITEMGKAAVTMQERVRNLTEQNAGYDTVHQANWERDRIMFQVLGALGLSRIVKRVDPPKDEPQPAGEIAMPVLVPHC